MDEKLKLLTQPLAKEDIEIRVGSCSEKSASFLLYKTARADTKRFNSVFGLGWKREHRIENGHYICKISVYNNETKEWISREDVGVESNTEKEKGAFSDSFKRAGFSFGYGIELYNAPFIKIYGITEQKSNGKFGLKDPYYANNLSIEEYSCVDGILSFKIYNTKTNTCVFDTSKKIFIQEQAEKKDISNNQPQQAIDTKKIFNDHKQELMSSTNLDELHSAFKKYTPNAKMFTVAQQNEMINIKNNMKQELLDEIEELDKIIEASSIPEKYQPYSI